MDEQVSREQSVAFGLVLKASPKVEKGERVIYCEPSTEGTDLQGERMLIRALQDSSEYFKAKGNFDIDHKTLRGESRLYEIGRPTEVRFDDGRVFVKGIIYSGTGKVAEQANLFWESLTAMQPPMPWWPSVGGRVVHAGAVVPNGQTEPVQTIQAVQWTNIGFAKEPVNTQVPTVSAMPLGTFAKAWIGEGSLLAQDVIRKAIEAGSGTDVAQLAGGAALRKESLGNPRRAALIRALCARALKRGRPNGSVVEHLVSTLEQAGLARASAIQGVVEFLRDMQQRREQRYER